MKKFLGISFLSGFVVLVVEVAATRLLTPYFGSSTFIWTSAISVVLAALAFGYFLGSRLSKREDVRAVLAWNFAAAAVLTAIIPFAVYLIGRLLPTFYQGNIPSVGAFVVTFMAALVVLLPAGISYGIVSPLIIELLGRDGHHPGEVSGQVFAVSTIGSILGTIITPLVFYPSLGTHLTFGLMAVLMMVLSAIVNRQRRWFLAAGAAALFFIFLATKPDPLRQRENLVYQKDSPYQLIQVFDDGGQFQLVYNEGLGVQSVYDPQTPWTGRYWDWPAVLPFIAGGTAQKNLVIGYAGGSIPRIWRDTPVSTLVDEVDGVEIDPYVVDLVKTRFDEELFGANVTIQDGRQFLAATDSIYDVILVDAYANEFQIPFHLATVEFFELAKSKLSERGIVSLNVAIGVKDSLLVRSLVRTVEEAFPHVYILQAEENYNLLVVASKQPKDFADLPRWVDASGMPYPPTFQVFDVEGEDGLVFVDDKAPVELLSELTLFHYF